jgi:ABC-2 type transport system permease protein
MTHGVKQVGEPIPPEAPPAYLPSREREGSPWVGLGAVITKEMADHLTSARMTILEFIIVLVAGGTAYVAINNIRTNVSQDPFLFMGLFTTGQDPLPAFIGFLPILVPLIAIALVFDSINGEFNKRTMSRVLSQPIHRDALLLGKFLGALFTLTLVLTAIWLLIIGMGLLELGVPPSVEEVVRMFSLLLATIFYGGIWLSLALVFSVAFRSPATAMLASIATWLFFFIMWSIIAGLLAQSLSPVQFGTPDEILAQANLQQSLDRVSPNYLFSEVMVAVLDPTVRSLSIPFILLGPPSGAITNAPMPVGQSLLIVWPQITGLIAVTILLFALAYVLFQRQEIRA